MKEPKTPQPKLVEVPKVESDRYLEGYVSGIYDAVCVCSLVALLMVGIYWYATLKTP